MINKKILNNEAIKKAKIICGKKETCKSEIIDKLKSWDIEENDFDEIITCLKNENFINEERFTQAYINDKLNFNKWGKLKIKYELSKKEIEEDIIEKALCKINKTYYLSVLNNELIKKNKSIKDENINKRRFKLVNFAKNKGFEYDLILQIISQITKK
jgi:regulatory protein